MNRSALLWFANSARSSSPIFVSVSLVKRISILSSSRSSASFFTMERLISFSRTFPALVPWSRPPWPASSTITLQSGSLLAGSTIRASWNVSSVFFEPPSSHNPPRIIIMPNSSSTVRTSARAAYAFILLLMRRILFFLRCRCLLFCFGVIFLSHQSFYSHMGIIRSNILFFL